MPLASTILMVRPAAFGFNEETAANNYFQERPAASTKQLQALALAEFNRLVETLQANRIDVVVIDDTSEPPKPDALFPNNWLATSPTGVLSIFPLFAPNRRLEKREEIIQQLTTQFQVRDVQDWSEFEAEGRFLEGTGSMVIDYDNSIIYACASERTSFSVLEKYAATNGLQAIVFVATDREGRPVYHTNVVMALGDSFCILCEEAIEEEWELIAVRQLLTATGHRIISITRDQMHSFAGNMLELINKDGKKILVMSQAAHDALRADQRTALEHFCKLLPVAVPTIERVEGGSVRCMMAEIFLTPLVPQG